MRIREMILLLALLAIVAPAGVAKARIVKTRLPHHSTPGQCMLGLARA